MRARIEPTEASSDIDASNVTTAKPLNNTKRRTHVGFSVNGECCITDIVPPA